MDPESQAAKFVGLDNPEGKGQKFLEGHHGAVGVGYPGLENPWGMNSSPTWLPKLPAYGNLEDFSPHYKKEKKKKKGCFGYLVPSFLGASPGGLQRRGRGAG